MKNLTKHKKLFFLVLFTFALSCNAEDLSIGNEIKQYDKIFYKISERREGVEESKIDSIVNPFIVVLPPKDGNTTDINASASKPAYVLSAIVNNKAKINNEWYKAKDKIGPYKVTRISRDTVLLRDKDDKLELSIRTKDDKNIKITYK
ncbi:MAG: hypothetical protein PHN38_02015 [Sulfurospirillaceae bacterium]|nr:hypothetical protein [Sulfurospirillaceae bacterium]MDD3463500.1 hypothetical protein [Sulfurospirillaceae bacterium]